MKIKIFNLCDSQHNKLKTLFLVSQTHHKKTCVTRLINKKSGFELVIINKTRHSPGRIENGINLNEVPIFYPITHLRDRGLNQTFSKYFVWYK